jgi:hypothetical protein
MKIHEWTKAAMDRDFPGGINLPSEAEVAELLYHHNRVPRDSVCSPGWLTWSEVQQNGMAERYYGAARLIIECWTSAVSSESQAA